MTIVSGLMAGGLILTSTCAGLLGRTMLSFHGVESLLHYYLYQGMLAPVTALFICYVQGGDSGARLR